MLLELEGDRRIDIHINNECIFRCACLNKHVEIIKLLLSLKGDRKINFNVCNIKDLIYYMRECGDKKMEKIIQLLNKKCKELIVYKKTEECCIVSHEEVDKYKICTSNVPHVISLNMYERIGKNICVYCNATMESTIYKNIRKSDRIKRNVDRYTYNFL